MGLLVQDLEILNDCNNIMLRGCKWGCWCRPAGRSLLGEMSYCITAQKQRSSLHTKLPNVHLLHDGSGNCWEGVLWLPGGLLIWNSPNNHTIAELSHGYQTRSCP